MRVIGTLAKLYIVSSDEIVMEIDILTRVGNLKIFFEIYAIAIKRT